MGTKKVLEIQDEAGYLWHINAHIIADNRAKYYATEDPDTTYEEEYEYAMSDGYELMDWYRGNMKWSEIPDLDKCLCQKPSIPTEPDAIKGYRLIEAHQ